MVFSSLTFLFAFLPVVLLGHVLFPERLRNAWLLIASAVFYAWGEGFFVAVMGASILANWIAGLFIEIFRGGRGQRVALGFGIAANVLLLGSYQYANFFVDNMNRQVVALGGGPWFSLPPVHLPIGISFFTFHAISYLMDVHRGLERAEKNPLRVALYISLFPQLVAGPIVRYGQVAGAIRQRNVTLD